MDRISRILLIAGMLLLLAGCTKSGQKTQPSTTAQSSRGTESGTLIIGSTLLMADYAMKSVDGKMVTLASVKGEKGTLVIFTCNHCPYVKAWQNRTVALANQALVDGFGVIAVNPNDPAAYPADDFEGMVLRAKAQGMNYPYVVDATSGVARAFHATRTPEVFLFNAGDSLVYHGAVDDNAQDANGVSEHYLRDALQAVLTGNPVATPETRSVGCTIKFRSENP